MHRNELRSLIRKNLSIQQNSAILRFTYPQSNHGSDFLATGTYQNSLSFVLQSWAYFAGLCVLHVTGVQNRRLRAWHSQRFGVHILYMNIIFIGPSMFCVYENRTHIAQLHALVSVFRPDPRAVHGVAYCGSRLPWISEVP